MVLKTAKGKRAKGSRNEKKAKDLLESEGWLVERVKNCGKFQKQVDFFGLFDLIAIREGQVLLVQVKTNRKPTMKPFKKFVKRYCTNCGIQTIRVHVMVWYDYKGFKTFEVRQ